MPILFRWLFTGCLARAGTTLMALLAIFAIIETFDKTRFLGDQFTVALLIEYLALKIPFMIGEFMPIVILLATSVFLVDLSRHHEIVAIRAAGLGINKIVLPATTVALLAAMISFAIDQWVAPVTNHRLESIERVHIKHQAAPHQRIQWLKDGHSFYRLTPLPHRHYALIILRTDEKGQWREKIESGRASYRDGKWILHHPIISRPSQEGLSITRRKQLIVPSAASPKTAAPPAPSEMDLLTLNRYVADLERAGLKAEPYIYALHKKLAAPLACLFMALLSIALCTHASGRSGAASWGVVLAIGLGLLFYVFNNASALLATHGQLPAAFAAWLPSCVFGGLSVFLLLQREGF
ncbi:MAG: LptF/LptG family permease [Zetaproteobacteria bacterium]|nr:MAG: LptF/LptG family permease [Zetaproteobacteria bacterium]